MQDKNNTNENNYDRDIIINEVADHLNMIFFHLARVEEEEGIKNAAQLAFNIQSEAAKPWMKLQKKKEKLQELSKINNLN